MSAHVVPKAKPFSEDDPDEKTTLDPDNPASSSAQWEDEASTTVEQGEVADKIRALGVEPAVPLRPITGLTNTGASALEEPTVDDQKANPALGLDVARLVITQGNDSGRELEIRPGKSYTIGRGLDNDFVLTDIAVSRKHFDLRNEDGAWVIVDRGSGNGTVVNGNIEDNPFMLANGDAIEIGNTTFRFDHANGVIRARDSFVDVDDEELSTVAGKPLRQEVVEAATPNIQRPARERPKTLPPPAPLRPASPSAQPYIAAPIAVPATTLPMPQMAGRQPMLAPNQPTMLGDSQAMQGMMPTTLPGQVAPRPSGYPMATEIPPHSVHAQMLQIAAQGGRHDPSTAHVAPSPFNPMPASVQLRQYVQPQLSKRTKMLLGAAALSAFAAILTVAILKSGSGKPADANPTPPPAPAADPPKPVALAPAPPTAPTPAPAPTPKAVAAVPTPAPAPKPVVPPKPAPAPAPPPKPVEVAKPAPKPVEVAKPEPRPEKKPPVVATARKRPPPPPEPKPEPAPRRVASAADADTAVAKASEQYKAKHFAEASNIVAAAARSAPDDEARQLRRRADLYLHFARAYNDGTAPGTKPSEAFQKIREAMGYDGSLGHFFDVELNSALSKIAPRAAIQFMAQKNYTSARTAVITAESLNGPSSDTKLVRDSLQQKAQELYSQANAEASSSPDDARAKLKTVAELVDGSSTLGQRAKKLLQQLAQ